MARERTVEDIRAELAGTRAKLKSSVADFHESIQPKNILKAGVDEAKGFAREEFNELKGQFVEPDGTWRTKRILAIVGAVAGIAAFAVTVNIVSGRRQLKAAKQPKAITAS